jgi:hypothetical protein
MIERLRILGITSSGLTAAGMHYLAAPAKLEHLEELSLAGNLLDSHALLPVLARAPRLTSLSFDGARLKAIIPALPPVTYLQLWDVNDETLAELGRSRCAPTLERLSLPFGSFETGDGFRAFPRLEMLDLMNSKGAPPARGLTAGMPALRSLCLQARKDENYPSENNREILEIARALGPQLEVLELSGIDPPGPSYEEFKRRGIQGLRGHGVLLDELRMYVAGRVITR